MRRMSARLATLTTTLGLMLLSAASAAAAEPGLSLVEQAAARSVVERRPVAPAEQFPADVGTVFAFVNLANPGATTQVKQRWTHAGRVRYEATLTVGKAPGWRTWSRHRMVAADAGDWTVDTLGPDGAVLGTLRFQVEAAPDARVTRVDLHR